jgi:hypothetical protein
MKALCTVLVVAAALLAPSPAEPACETPYPNKTVVTWNDVRVTFATDRVQYALGDTVHFFLCVENTGSVPFVHFTNYGPQDMYLVVNDSCVTPDGIASDCPTLEVPFSFRSSSPLPR